MLCSRPEHTTVQTGKFELDNRGPVVQKVNSAIQRKVIFFKHFKVFSNREISN